MINKLIVKLIVIVLVNLLLLGCNSVTKKTNFSKDNTIENKVEPKSNNTKSLSISEPPRRRQDDRNGHTETSKTRTRSSSPSPCASTTTITTSNKISLLKDSEGRKTLSCSGTYCSGFAQSEGKHGFNKFTDDAVFVANEVVYEFKDGKCATFDTFTVIANPTLQNFNEEEFELLVGQDSPTGKFESIGKFTVDGQTTFRTFHFEPQVGRYFKVKKLTGATLIHSTYKFQLWGAVE